MPIGKKNTHRCASSRKSRSFKNQFKTIEENRTNAARQRRPDTQCPLHLALQILPQIASPRDTSASSPVPCAPNKPCGRKWGCRLITHRHKVNHFCHAVFTIIPAILLTIMKQAVSLHIFYCATGFYPAVKIIMPSAPSYADSIRSPDLNIFLRLVLTI